MAKERNGLSEAEAGRLGGIVTATKLKAEKKKRVEEYLKNPKRCPVCGGIIPYEDKSWKKFCSSSCAAKYNNVRRDADVYIRQSETLRKRLGTYDEEKYGKSHRGGEFHKNEKSKRVAVRICPICGAVGGTCKHPEICKKHQFIKGLVRFGLDYSKKGTEEIYDEYFRIKKQLEEDYKRHINDKELAEKYGYTSGLANFHKVLKSFGIKTRNLTEAVRESYFYHPYTATTSSDKQMFVEGWHTSWDGKSYYLRSSYEFDYAKELDDKNIEYKVEEFRIKYFDSIKQDYRCAIPDFYLPLTNEIVEIKSTWTLNLQNMKDKFKAYKELGYTPKLVLEHKETDIESL